VWILAKVSTSLLLPSEIKKHENGQQLWKGGSSGAIAIEKKSHPGVPGYISFFSNPSIGNQIRDCTV
jgi:hypothetical protein